MSVDREAISRALPGYDLQGEIADGVWGVVVAGRQRELGRQVAIKQLPPAFAALPEVRESFLDVSRVVASLDHPHIAKVLDFAEQDGTCALVMELLDGGTVRDRFRQRGFTPRGACTVALAACAALQRAHDRDMLHRDIRPETLMFSGEDVLKITDFGMAEIICGPTTLETRDGRLLGTPAYMSLEQQLGEELSPASDIYSLGTVLFELLSGELPFPKKDEGLEEPEEEERPWPLAAVAPGVPAELAAAVDRALAEDPEARFPSAVEFGRELAGAATTAWGRGWETVTGITLRGVGSMLPTEEGGLRQASAPFLRRPLREAISRPLREPTVQPRQPPPEPAARATEVSPNELVIAGAPPRKGLPRRFIAAMVLVILVPAVIAEVLRHM